MMCPGGRITGTAAHRGSLPAMLITEVDSIP